VYVRVYVYVRSQGASRFSTKYYAVCYGTRRCKTTLLCFDKGKVIKSFCWHAP